MRLSNNTYIFCYNSNTLGKKILSQKLILIGFLNIIAMVYVQNQLLVTLDITIVCKNIVKVSIGPSTQAFIIFNIFLHIESKDCFGLK